MMHGAHISAASVFAADRRVDVSVRINDLIFKTAGKEAEAIADHLTKACAALLHGYPNICLAISISRLIADADYVIRQDVRFPEIYVAPMLEMHLNNVMATAANRMQTFDPLAFITVDVTHKPIAVMASKWHRNKQRWWQSND